MIAQTRLRELLRYDSETGHFTWIATTSRRVRIGSVAGYRDTDAKKKLSYIRIGIDGRLHRAHRLAFLYMLGRWPNEQVDHKDGDGTNNKWSNLREATASQNATNRGPSCVNGLGLKGVYPTPSGKYTAAIQKHGKQVWLGTYVTAQEALKAHTAAEQKLFGDFCR